MNGIQASKLPSWIVTVFDIILAEDLSSKPNIRPKMLIFRKWPLSAILNGMDPRNQIISSDMHSLHTTRLLEIGKAQWSA